MTVGEEDEIVVIDNGSGLIKAGMSGEDTPRSIFHNHIGAVKDPEKFINDFGNAKLSGRETGHEFVGPECQDLREHLDLLNPIERGQIVDWDRMEQVWDYTFSHELQLSPESSNVPVLLTDTPLGPKSARDRMAQIMFEVFKVPSFYVMQQSVLSLFASGRTRGIVAECGHGITHAVPVFEGYALPHAILRLDIAGSDITQCLERKIAKQYQDLATSSIEQLKEKLCYVKTDQEQDKDTVPFELPDGSIISVDSECRSSVAEILFTPSLLSSDHPAHGSRGIHEIVSESIKMCDHDLQKDLLGSVVLAGGSTMLPGFAQRMAQELGARHPESIKVIPGFKERERGYNSQRAFASWVGGSMFASLPTIKQLLVTKQEWEESHETIIHRKCF